MSYNVYANDFHTYKMRMHTNIRAEMGCFISSGCKTESELSMNLSKVELEATALATFVRDELTSLHASEMIRFGGDACDRSLRPICYRN